MYDTNHKQDDYFPIFMMGNSLQSLIKNRVPADKTPMKSMASVYNTNMKLRARMDPAETYLFDELINS